MLTIFHELFHAASSYIDQTNETVYTGFEIIHNGEILAEGLNEGYTQYLTEKYFGDRDIFITYQFERRVAEILENIIGEKRMRWCYFNASLSSLINDLEKYSPYEDIMVFIKDLDYVSNNLHKDTISKEIKEQVENKLKNISEFLIKVLVRQNLNITGIANYSLSIDILAPIISKIPSYIKVDGEDYQIMDLDTIKESIEAVFDEKKLTRKK